MAEYKQHYMRAGWRSDLKIRNVTFSHVDVKVAAWLYDDMGFTLWQIKEVAFRALELRVIVCAIIHDRLDKKRTSYHQRESYLWNPEAVALEYMSQMNVGAPMFTEDEDPNAEDPGY